MRRRSVGKARWLSTGVEAPGPHSPPSTHPRRSGHLPLGCREWCCSGRGVRVGPPQCMWNVLQVTSHLRPQRRLHLSAPRSHQLPLPTRRGELRPGAGVPGSSQDTSPRGQPGVRESERKPAPAQRQGKVKTQLAQRAPEGAHRRRARTQRRQVSSRG